jgi:hypothetical protein
MSLVKMLFHINPNDMMYSSSITLEDYDLPEPPLLSSWAKFVSQMNPYGDVPSLIPTLKVDESFLKMIEVLNRLQIILPSNNYQCFFNGCSSGDIAGFYHWWQTNYKGLELAWKACNYSRTFQDDRKHYANHQSHWLMNPPATEGIIINENNGDMNDEDEVNRVSDEAGVDNELYISTNIDNKTLGYLKCGLLSLAGEGNMIFRLDTMLDDLSTKVIHTAMASFKEVYVFKPYTSPMVNAEVYLIGISFDKEKRDEALGGLNTEYKITLAIRNVIDKIYGLRVEYVKSLIKEFTGGKKMVHLADKTRQVESMEWLRIHAVRDVKGKL